MKEMNYPNITTRIIYFGFYTSYYSLNINVSMYICQTKDIARGGQPLYFIHHSSLNHQIGQLFVCAIARSWNRAIIYMRDCPILKSGNYLYARSPDL